jgi:hypothetical protein
MVEMRAAPLPGSPTAGAFDGYVLSKTATTWVGAPDLSDSFLDAQSEVQYDKGQKGNPAPVQVITYSLVLRNSSLQATGPMSASINFSSTLDPLEKSADATYGAVQLVGSQLLWVGSVGARETMTASLTLTQTAGLDQLLPTVAYIYDPVTRPFIRSLFFAPLPYRSYSPLLAAPP